MTQITRRSLLAGLAVSPFAAGAARAQELILPNSFNLYAGAARDQSAEFVAACNAAAAVGMPLFLPAGIYTIGDVALPSNLLLQGVPGATVLQFTDTGGTVRIDRATGVTLDGLVLEGHFTREALGEGNLQITDSYDVRVSRCDVRNGRSNGIYLSKSAATITDCGVGSCDAAGILALDSRGVKVTGCRITGHGDGGVLVWRSEPGRDGTIISGNTIAQIDFRSGGNGQHGNGINVFRADEVIISDNHIADVMFSAVRLNATNDTQIVGNTCMNCKEVAIFSEFGFSGSLIANNIVDRAAAGISMTNFDSDGRLAVCSGNIVRNIFERSEVNPDTTPFGIFAEADAVISGNLVDTVPGLGIGAGWGPYLRDVSVTGNVVRDTNIGIGVSVADGAGSALISDNLISGTAYGAIAAMAWTEVVSDNLERDAARFPNVTVGGNRLG